MRRSFLALIPQVLFACSLIWGQEQKLPDDLPGVNMPAAVSSPAPSADAPKPDASTSTTPTPDATEPIRQAPQTQPEVRTPAISLSDTDMRDMAGTNADGTAHAMRSMEDRQMSMGPHTKMTTLRDLKPGDQEKADQVVAAARRAAEKYTDYRVALSDGYRIFLPKLPQRQYHFTNYRYAFESAIGFDPEHPTSLLYEKRGDDYKLIGVMYTAPKNASWSELDQRIPLSIAQWHAHVNMCIPPADRRNEAWGPKAKFGLVGSITTKADCDAAGGKFMPQIFGWMVHVYPFEQKPEDIWSVERQAHMD